jgi:hypothetical protein
VTLSAASDACGGKSRLAAAFAFGTAFVTALIFVPSDVPAVDPSPQAATADSMAMAMALPTNADRDGTKILFSI